MTWEGSIPILLNRYASEDGGKEYCYHESNVGPIEDLDRTPEPGLEAAKPEQEKQNRRFDQRQLGIVQHNDDVIQDETDLRVILDWRNLPYVDTDVLQSDHGKGEDGFDGRQNLHGRDYQLRTQPQDDLEIGGLTVANAIKTSSIPEDFVVKRS